jgi:hypothetical protein
MSIVKTSECSVITIPDAVSDIDNAFGVKISSIIGNFDKDTVYSVVAGIPGDVFNENHDMWLWKEELCSKKPSGIYTYETWRGVPVCVGHKNNSVLDHYGKVLDVWPDQDKKIVYMLLGTSYKLNPRLAEGIKTGVINKVSMGCVVKYSTCSYCGSVAHTVSEYCDHLRYNKGRVLPINKGLKHCDFAKVSDSMVKVGEVCYDSMGTEMSWVVNPAFPNCVAVDILKESSEDSSNDTISNVSSGFNMPLSDQYSLLAKVLKRSSNENERKLAGLLDKAASKGNLTDSEVKAINKLIELASKSGI